MSIGVPLRVRATSRPGYHTLLPVIRKGFDTFALADGDVRRLFRNASLQKCTVKEMREGGCLPLVAGGPRQPTPKAIIRLAQDQPRQ